MYERVKRGIILFMADTIDKDLLQKIEAHLAQTGTKDWEFGRKSINDPALVDDLRAGRELRRGTRDRVLAFLAKPLSEQQRAS